jgi:hypothetical protein
MTGARASGVVIILALAMAFVLDTAAAQTAEQDLAPITLTPQRMQSIGVKTGVVERRKVQDEIRTVGNVEADETRLADVQVRFSGWVQKVYANATYKTRANRFSPSTAWTWSSPSRNIWWPKNS